MSEKLELDKRLCDTDFTVGWLLDSLTKNDEAFNEGYRNRKVSKITARDISGGKGMFSIVLKCELSFEDSKNETDIYTTVIKVPGSYVFDQLKENGDLDLPDPEAFNIVGMHATEVRFYEIFKTRMPRILPKLYYTQLWVPGQHQGCLHMEDLSKRGASLNYYDCLNHGQIRSIVRGLAHFHKQVMCSDEEEWREKFPVKTEFFKDSEKFYETMPKHFAEYLKSDDQREAFKSYINDSRLGKIIRNDKFYRYVGTQCHLAHDIPDTIYHGDLWNNNIIFKRDANGAISNDLEAFLDWQLVQEGNLVFDFARLLTCSCEGDIRREAETYIFEYFVECLGTELKGTGIKIQYTAKKLREVYDYVLVAHSSHPIFMLTGFFKTKSSKPEEKLIDDARIDRCVLRAFHLWEDTKKLSEDPKFDFWVK